MKIYVGTSGWSYPWNKRRSLEWYVENTPFQAVELNSSFYRLPKPSTVKEWLSFNLKWSVKVHREITHVKRLKDVDMRSFMELFRDLNPRFYLFQLPPSFKRNEENERRVLDVLKEVPNAVFEFRDKSWFESPPNVPLVSVDSPIGTYIFQGKVVYLRMHGRERWYFHNYTDQELIDVAKKIVEINPEETYVFFNNDLWMLENGKRFLDILKSMLGKE
ncbi:MULTISPECIES: DUF72 domain-containing protein [Metallosphaera]|uniref:DUF72 domain-containing protein n=1 Tax=Metallosphaera TaxID=41980 RepID=UPI001F05B83C|nr:DUF72 domain-containing protein [Metallosphaera sedula]MCH1771178.1 DUF72 domain-containing protein [Metallosphaera sedula]MCP6729550.1 DUF72 domain-containing protein [Metallosphaera sedula]